MYVSIFKMSNKEDFKIDSKYEIIERMIDCNGVSIPGLIDFVVTPTILLGLLSAEAIMEIGDNND